ncbi:hypothetical protein R3P38DRAFT_3225539 [Favolaschia claudopus]|uniref:Uncharacterized protein n=1 Tax=Favolaschia claudopus TaxID=2862362 RepID=A0AAV9ZU72_9AGAR
MESGERESPVNEPPPEKQNTKAKRNTKKPYQLKKVEIPKEFEGAKYTVHLHGYILYGITQSNTAPHSPSDGDIAHFNLQMAPGYLETLERKLCTHSNQHAGASVMVKILLTQAQVTAAAGSLIAGHILLVSKTFLLATYNAVFATGLKYFRPNVFSPPHTLYNQVHQLVSLFALEDKQPLNIIRMLQEQCAHSDDEEIIDADGRAIHMIDSKGIQRDTIM